MRVGQPAEALVALVAVRGNAVQIGFRTPQHDALDLVQNRLRCRETAHGLHVTVDLAAEYGVELRRSGEAGQLHVAEAVISEVRFVDFALRIAAQNVRVGRAHRPQILDIQRPVFVQQFGVAHPNRGARRASHSQPDPAAEVLPHIENEDARLWACHFQRDDVSHGPNRRHHLRRQNSFRQIVQADGLPHAAVVIMIN